MKQRRYNDSCKLDAIPYDRLGLRCRQPPALHHAQRRECVCGHERCGRQHADRHERPRQCLGQPEPPRVLHQRWRHVHLHLRGGRPASVAFILWKSLQRAKCPPRTCVQAGGVREAVCACLGCVDCPPAGGRAQDLSPAKVLSDGHRVAGCPPSRRGLTPRGTASDDAPREDTAAIRGVGRCRLSRRAGSVKARCAGTPVCAGGSLRSSDHDLVPSDLLFLLTSYRCRRDCRRNYRLTVVSGVIALRRYCPLNGSARSNCKRRQAELAF